MRLSRLLATLTALAVCSNSLVAQSFSSVVAFGDSLTDNHNFHAQTANPPPPYWQGRFSNGPVWVEQLANHVGVAAAAIDDRAVGFATTSDVFQLQVLAYVNTPGGADSGALHVYWAGANDLFGVLAGATTPSAAIAGAMQNTADSMIALLSGGARHILVLDIPDLGLVPEIAGLHDPAIAGAATSLTMAYNHALDQTLQSIDLATGAHFTRLSGFDLITSLAGRAREGGFTVTDTAALSSQGTVAPNVERYLFWDHVHPTTRAHSFVAGAAFESLGGLWGDVDGNGVRDGSDVAALASLLGACQPGCSADMNGDGVVDGDDRGLLLLAIH